MADRKKATPEISQLGLQRIFDLAIKEKVAFRNYDCPKFPITYRLFVGESVVCVDSNSESLDNFFDFLELQGIDKNDVRENLWYANNDVEAAEARGSLDFKFSREKENSRYYSKLLPWKTV